MKILFFILISTTLAQISIFLSEKCRIRNTNLLCKNDNFINIKTLSDVKKIEETFNFNVTGNVFVVVKQLSIKMYNHWALVFEELPNVYYIIEFSQNGLTFMKMDNFNSAVIMMQGYNQFEVYVREYPRINFLYLLSFIKERWDLYLDNKYNVFTFNCQNFVIHFLDYVGFKFEKETETKYLVDSFSSFYKQYFFVYKTHPIYVGYRKKRLIFFVDLRSEILTTKKDEDLKIYFN